MPLEPYKQKDWLYYHYVQKRMNLKDIVVLLQEKYNIKISHQSIYNWLVKYDLLKYRGKGRKIGANLQVKKQTSQMGKRPDKMREERMRALARAKKKRR